MKILKDDKVVVLRFKTFETTTCKLFPKSRINLFGNKDTEISDTSRFIFFRAASAKFKIKVLSLYSQIHL
ncbi:MAG: hypothetical protein BGO87_05915 [Flavobacteriia bacterium 40-80]|nr:MAG: hypothetical protein BGO87_05915 [Flavobacteriia bacterium 40-80]